MEFQKYPEHSRKTQGGVTHVPDIELEDLRQMIASHGGERGWAALTRETGVPQDTLKNFASGKVRRPQTEALRALEQWATRTLSRTMADGTLLPDQSQMSERESRLQFAVVTSSRYWSGVMSSFRVMKELTELAAFELSESELLALHDDLLQRVWIVNNFARRRSDNSPGVLEHLEVFNHVQRLNLEIFERVAQPRAQWPALSIVDPRAFMQSLGLDALATQLRIQRHPQFGYVWLISAGEVITFAPEGLMKSEKKARPPKRKR